MGHIIIINTKLNKCYNSVLNSHRVSIYQLLISRVIDLLLLVSGGGDGSIWIHNSLGTTHNSNKQEETEEKKEEECEAQIHINLRLENWWHWLVHLWGELLWELIWKPQWLFGCSLYHYWSDCFSFKNLICYLPVSALGFLEILCWNWDSVQWEVPLVQETCHFGVVWMEVVFNGLECWISDFKCWCIIKPHPPWVERNTNVNPKK